MRILLVNDPGIPVPPTGYGGIERMIDLLAKEYLRLGHTVDVLASEGSSVAGCNHFSIGPAGFPPSKISMRKAILNAWAFIRKNRNHYDLIHSFGRLLYLLPVLNHPVMKIMSYQREINPRNAAIYNKLPNRNMFFTGCSQDLIDRAKPPGKWQAIHNGIDFTKYQLNTSLLPNAPLIFLGRIERIKGCHRAIQVVKETNRRLIIAGNVSNQREEMDYFHNEINPHIDGNQIKYVGEVNDDQKNLLLGQSMALLMPIEWNEPFGIVMIEAMACGTPVIGNRMGAIPEVIENGITGLVSEDFSSAMEKINKIDRENCRAVAEKKFDIKVIAKQYLNIIG